MVNPQMTTPSRRAAVPDIVAAAFGTGVTAVLDQVRSLAAQAITAHVDNVGACGACGASWPCPQAQLAEHNLAML